MTMAEPLGNLAPDPDGVIHTVSSWPHFDGDGANRHPPEMSRTSRCKHRDSILHAAFNDFLLAGHAPDFLTESRLRRLGLGRSCGRGAVVGAEELARVLDRPVLDVSFVKRPVKIASVELLRAGRVYLVRTRSTDGVEAITVPNPARTALMYPLFLKQIVPVFIGKDARDLERLLWDVYRHDSNYKLQGLALWVCVAAIEMALLELLGQTAQRPLADFFGGTVRRDIPIYVASGNRGNRPEAEITHLQKLIAESGARALKFRLGGRMSRNADSLPGRTEALIPKVREVFGDGFTLYADANSSYDAREGTRVGRLLEAHNYGFYEEPCEFDDLWSTKEVADALTIPVAGGEQEFSLHRWRWLIANARWTSCSLTCTTAAA